MVPKLIILYTNVERDSCQTVIGLLIQVAYLSKAHYRHEACRIKKDHAEALQDMKAVSTLNINVEIGDPLKLL